MIVVETSGPLFEGKIHVGRGTRLGLERATAHAAELARGRLRSATRYSTAKYGRAAQSVRTRVEAVAGTGDQFVGRAYLGGQSAFLAPWLEFGVKGHPIPAPGRRKARTRIQTVRASGGLRRDRVTSSNVLLAIPTGSGVRFRTYRLDKPFMHRGTRAQHWASQTQAEINRLAPDMIRQALMESGA